MVIIALTRLETANARPIMGRPSSNAAVVKPKIKKKEVRRGIRSIGHAHFHFRASLYTAICYLDIFLPQSTGCGPSQPQVRLEGPRPTYLPVKEM